MSDLHDKAEWIDADAWLGYIKRGLETAFAKLGFHAGRPLNYHKASRLARQGRFEYEHQSDGSTLIRIGADRVKKVKEAQTKRHERWKSIRLRPPSPSPAKACPSPGNPP